jgi:hypothetical protein
MGMLRLPNPEAFEGSGTFELRSEAFFRDILIIAFQLISPVTGGPYSGQVILHPH